MQIPVDVKAVVDEALDIEEARNTPLSVSVYVDESAPEDVRLHVLDAFSTEAPHARVAVAALTASPLAPYRGDDMAVIVAGLLSQTGAHAAALRAAGVPVMVVTTLPDLVGEIARAEGHPIPEGDLVSPASRPRCRMIAGDAAAQAPADAARPEPCPLDEASSAALGERMGGWVVDACRDKRLAFALAFPFVRRPLSLDAVGATAMQNAGIGFIVFIPGADLPVMTLNQAKMLLQIAAAYGQPMGMERVRELAAVVGGAFACRAVARQVAGAVPGLGWVVKAAVGYAGTVAMGRAAIEYFEGGGSIGGLASVAAKARDAAARGAAGVRACAQATGAHAVEGRAPHAAQVVRDAGSCAARGAAAVARAAGPFAAALARAGASAAGFGRRARR